MFHGILSVPHNIVMDLNNVMMFEPSKVIKGEQRNISQIIPYYFDGQFISYKLCRCNKFCSSKRTQGVHSLGDGET